ARWGQVSGFHSHGGSPATSTVRSRSRKPRPAVASSSACRPDDDPGARARAVDIERGRPPENGRVGRAAQRAASRIARSGRVQKSGITVRTRQAPPWWYTTEPLTPVAPGLRDGRSSEDSEGPLWGEAAPSKL